MMPKHLMIIGILFKCLILEARGLLKLISQGSYYWWCKTKFQAISLVSFLSLSQTKFITEFFPLQHAVTTTTPTILY